jgi:hypothetical protein
MAKLLRLHLSCVGHKDARFFPLTLEFRNRQGDPTDCVVWLMNGGGKSSMMNLFYSSILPESREFLGSKNRLEKSDKRKLTDYVKANDIAVILSEWQMPSATNLFSGTRIVGQVLVWKGGVATPDDESRLEREFFTFRGGERMPFDSLPFHGLAPQPLTSITKVKEWLTQLSAEYPQLEVERADQRSKGKWRDILDRAGIDTELFNYHLKMNVREGGAAELFKVRDTMEFVDLFLQMALNSEQADKTREQIEAVREKLLRLPQKDLEERFALVLLEQLRPLSHEASAANTSEIAWREQRRGNFLLRTAIENAIKTTERSLTKITADLANIRKSRVNAHKQKLARQEYRLNYHNLARELTFREAQQAEASAREKLQAALVGKNLAAAGIRFARIASRQLQLDELNRLREAELTEEKPVLDELHALGAAYKAALSDDLARIDELLKTSKNELSKEIGNHDEAAKSLTQLRDDHARTTSELDTVKRRLVQRDQRRASLRQEGFLLPDEKAVDALERWRIEQRSVESAVSAAEARMDEIDADLQTVRQKVADLSVRRQYREQEAIEKDRAWHKGDADGKSLRECSAIREVLASDSPDLDFPDLMRLVHLRRQQLDEEFIQGRLDRVDDERTLHSFEVERLFPASREVELVVTHLRDRGIKTALPAYRFLATNATLNGTARHWLSRDPARFSGVVVTNEKEFESLQKGPFAVHGLRHPVQITLSGNPDETNLKSQMTVALPSGDGAFNYEAAAIGQSEVESRLEQSDVRIGALETRKHEALDVIQRLSTWQKEFGEGALARFASERDQLQDEMSRLGSQIGAARAAETVRVSERSSKASEAKELRPRVAILVQRQERLHGYIQEYESHDESWLEERREKIALIEQLHGQIAAQEREVNRLSGEIESRRERVRLLAAEYQQRRAQQDAIRFHNALVAHKPPTLEAAVTRYNIALARYDEKFGRSELDGQIKQAQLHLAELRDDDRKLSSGLSAEEVAVAAKHPDLEGRREEAEREHLKAHSINETAIATLVAAEKDRPAARAHKQGLGLPPDQPTPETSKEAINCREALDRAIEADTIQITDLDSKISETEREEQTLKSRIVARTPHITTLEDIIDSSDGAPPALPEDDLLVSQIVSNSKRQTQSFFQQYQVAKGVVDERVEQLHTVSRKEEFSAIPIIARERLANLPREELLQRCDEFIQSHEAWQKVLRNEIETLSKDKDLVVRALDGVAASAVRLLGKAEKASIMPDAFPGWSGQPFLRITAQPVTEPAARRDRLAALVSRLVAEKAIPTGHALASAALREVGGTIRATLLKPEDPLRPDRYDITEFGTFSEGEKMTAAVLLYVTLAQLRTRGREEHTRERQAGVLLLDNPFGTASKREFVELQLRLARQMGVQLIYTTGVNDLGALDVLPRILRLRKRHRDRRSGDLLISQELPEEHVEGVHANLRI